MTMAYDLGQTPEQKAKKAIAKQEAKEAAELLAKENDKKLKKAMERRIRKQMEKQKAEDELNLNLGKGVKDDCEDAKKTREENKERLQLDAKEFGEKEDIKQFEKRAEKKKTPNKRFTVTMDEMESDYFRPRPHMASRYHQHLEKQFPMWLEQSGNTEYDAFVKAKKNDVKAEFKKKSEEKHKQGFEDDYEYLAEQARKYQCSKEEEEELLKLDSLVERLGEYAAEWEWVSGADSFKTRIWFFMPDGPSDEHLGYWRSDAAIPFRSFRVSSVCQTVTV